jgi:hypothetical protein
MAIGTQHHAFRNFRGDRAPLVRAAQQTRHIVSLLLSHVVKLEHDRVALPTINAWMRTQELQHPALDSPPAPSASFGAFVGARILRSAHNTDAAPDGGTLDTAS